MQEGAVRDEPSTTAVAGGTSSTRASPATQLLMRRKNHGLHGSVGITPTAGPPWQLHICATVSCCASPHALHQHGRGLAVCLAAPLEVVGRPGGHRQRRAVCQCRQRRLQNAWPLHERLRIHLAPQAGISAPAEEFAMSHRFARPRHANLRLTSARVYLPPPASRTGARSGACPRGPRGTAGQETARPARASF